MFELLFGGAFTLSAAFFTVMLLGTIFLEGEPMVLFGLLFMIPFWTVGIVYLKKGIIKVKQNADTKRFGTETYGLVVEFTDSGCYVNDCEVWNAHVLVVTDYGFDTFVESAGTNPQFDIGDFVAVKYYNGDVNIKERVGFNSVPEATRNKIMSVAPTNLQQRKAAFYGEDIVRQQPTDFIVDGDYIIVDGVRYLRPQK